MVMTLSFCHGDLNLDPRPREALVIYNQSAEGRRVTDDQGIDFLSFPREVRDRIYTFISVKPAFIGCDAKFTKPFYRDAIAWRNLDFAGSCRQIWNESLRVYLANNGFEFFYIRPFLEFLEKIGIRGRRLLTGIRWHHHRRSRPFIVLRYLRSCTALQTLRVFARVTVTERKRFWWGVPLLNAKDFFLTEHSKIEFGAAQGFGKDAEVDEEPPDFSAIETRSLATLSENLKKVKWEVSGHYKRPDLPCILENGMCHWKYKMIDEKKQRRKAEMNRQEGEAQAEGQGDGRVEADANVERGNRDEDDEMIDGDDGYVIKNGNLVKDGIVVADGAVFDIGFLLEDGRRVEDGAGDVINGSGGDADMMLENKMHVAAENMAVDDDITMDGDMAVDGGMAVDNKMMLYER